ncbi:collagen, type I, alpha 1a-like [Struthio camelus]|uniref:collagen, type I, alpha 1a-like n=1 Tax=Struthio camelus TaxID=8801 RepID=UPI003603F575
MAQKTSLCKFTPPGQSKKYSGIHDFSTSSANFAATRQPVAPRWAPWGRRRAGLAPLEALLGPGLLLLVAAAALLAAAWWRWALGEGPGPGPGPEVHPTGSSSSSAGAEPRCRRAGCARCAAAARELQRRVLAARAGPAAGLGPRSVASWGSSTWRAAWWDLEELVRAGGLSWGSSSSDSAAGSARRGGRSGHRCPFCPPPRGRAAPSELQPRPEPGPSPPRSRSAAAPGPEGRAPAGRGAARPPGSERDGRASPSLQSHLARKGLEIWLGALPGPVRRSQQRAALRQGRPGLPKPIGPGQARPLARRRLCPWLQGKADAVAANVLQKHLQGLWGVPNPTEESLARLVPCPPPLLAPLDPGPPRGPPAPRSAPASSAGSSRGAGTRGPGRPPRRLQQQPAPEPPGRAAGGGEAAGGAEDPPAGARSSAGRAPGSAARDGPRRRGGGLPPSTQEPPGGPLAPGTAAPGPELASPAAGPAGAAAPKAGADLEADSSAGEDGSRPGAAGPVGASKPELSRDVRRRLWLHAARKCLETRLRMLPAAVRRSLEASRPAPPQLPPERLCPPEPAARPRPGRSPGGRRPPPVHIAVPEALFLPEEQREALELHVRAKRLQRRGDLLGPRPGPAPPGEEEGGGAAPGAGSLPGALGGAGDEAAATSEAPGKSRGTPKPWAGPAAAVVSPVLVPAAAGSARGDAAAAPPFLEKEARASAEARSRPQAEAQAGEEEEEANARGREPQPAWGLAALPEEPPAGTEERPSAAAPAALATAQEPPAASEGPAQRQGVLARCRAPRQGAPHGDRSPPRQGRGCSPPASVATLRWSRRQILRALESGLQEMAQSRSQRDGTETPVPKQPPSPPSHLGALPQMVEGPLGAPNPAPGEPAPRRTPPARRQVSAPWLEHHVVQRALGTFLLPPCPSLELVTPAGIYVRLSKGICT